MARQQSPLSRLISFLFLQMMVIRVACLQIASTTARSAFVGGLQRFQAHRMLLTRARPAVAGASAAATTTTTMTWTNPGGSNKKRQQISGPSAEELERRVRQKVTEVATAVDSFLGGGEAQAHSEALAMHARYREHGEVATTHSPASASASSSSGPSSSPPSFHPSYTSAESFSATPAGPSYAHTTRPDMTAGPSYAHTTRPDMTAYLSDSYAEQAALSAGAAGAGNRLGLGRGGGLGFGLGLGLGSGLDAGGMVDGMGAIGSFFGVTMNTKPKRRVSNLDFD